MVIILTWCFYPPEAASMATSGQAVGECAQSKRRWSSANDHGGGRRWLAISSIRISTSVLVSSAASMSVIMRYVLMGISDGSFPFEVDYERPDQGKEWCEEPWL